VTLEDLFEANARLPLMAAADIAEVSSGSGEPISRRRGEGHPCAFCGAQASAPLARHDSPLLGPARWLDLCHAHGLEARAMADALRDLTGTTAELDAEIARRHTAWSAARAAT
jgi:transposase